jgi:AcrR family transcriptional regulator
LATRTVSRQRIATQGAPNTLSNGEPKAPFSPKGRRRISRAGASTRVKLLDAAERLFADHGYDGTSLRDIATQSKQHLALSTYHFGTKERLFEEVLQRRAAEMEAIRLAALGRIEISSLSASDAVRALIEAYSLPMIRASHGASRQWRAHVRLLSQLIGVKRWVPLIQKYYDHCGLQFISRLEEVLPHVDRNALLDSFSFMISNMLYVCSYTNRFNKAKEHKHKLSVNEDIAAATQNFLRFTYAGFMALRS